MLQFTRRLEHAGMPFHKTHERTGATMGGWVGAHLLTLVQLFHSSIPGTLDIQVDRTLKCFAECPILDSRHVSAQSAPHI
jgi:hypothetical protein